MSTRKRLVIIIDRSGSMRAKQRMVLAKDAALTVLNTLTPDDYVSKSSCFSALISYGKQPETMTNDNNYRQNSSNNNPWMILFTSSFNKALFIATHK